MRNRQRGAPSLIDSPEFPDALLEAVFAALLSSERQDRRRPTAHSPPSGPDGPHLPLVCRRWRRVYNSSPLLHGTLNLNLLALEAQLAACDGGRAGLDDEALLLRLLGQRGAAARRLWLHNQGDRLRMSGVLQLMFPRLQALYLGPGAPCDSLAHLQRFSGSLLSLDLPAPAAGAGAALLPAFTRLEELTLREGTPQGILSTLAGLPRLRLLSLTLTGALPIDGHRQLARLAALEELHLYLQPSTPTPCDFQPGALAGLTRLRSLLLLAPGCSAEVLSLGPGLPLLPALQELQVECRVEGLPPDLWGCRHLTRLELDLKGSAALPPPGSPPGAPCLPALLELRLARCLLPGGVLPPVVCRPPALRRLEVVRCGLTGGCAHAALPPQFSSLSSLEHLSLEANTLCTLPCGVAALPALRHLDLSCNALAWLPPGAYLHSLETLILSSNRLAVVPSVLSGAPALEVLDLSSNPALELCRADVDATLARIPRLALLCLGKQAASSLGMPALGGGAAAAAAQGLEWRTPSVAALVALGQALPSLQIDFERTAKEYEGI